MPKYALYGYGQMTNSHRFLIGPPLVVISVFCFAFVLIQPHASTQFRPTASSHPKLPAGTSRTPVPILTYNNQPALTQLTPAALPSADKVTALTIPLANVGRQLSNTGTTKLRVISSSNQKTGREDWSIKIQGP